MLFINSKQTYHLSVEGNCDWNMTKSKNDEESRISGKAREREFR